MTEELPGSGEIDTVFKGPIPRLYDSYLVPLIFAPYAGDIAGRLASWPLSRVLEIACGTGVATRAMAAALSEEVEIIATDLNTGMLDEASRVGTTRLVEWRQADVMELPFQNDMFDAVVCQFGAMFFTDKRRAFAEVRRVLKPRGVFIFNVWDRIEENEFANTITISLESLFADDPPRFLARTPHGYHDCDVISRDLASGGFTSRPRFETIAARSRARSPRVPAIAYVQGTPLRVEIEARDASRLGEAIDVATAAVGAQFGMQDVDGKIQAHVVVIER